MKDFLKTRPMSWSQLSAFEYNKGDWYKKYIQGIQPKSNPEMVFGKALAHSIEDGRPLAPVTILPKCEYKFEFTHNGKKDGIPCIGFADGFDPESKRKLCEYKSGVKAWDHGRVRLHGQIDFYLLGNYILHKVKPEEVECFLQWIPTKKIYKTKTGLGNKEYTIEFATDPPAVHTFPTARTMTDILLFGERIERTVKAMDEYVTLQTV